MRVSLRPDLEQFIQEKVRTGQYPSADAVVTDAVEAMRAQEASTPEEIEDLRQELAEAIAQADRGEFVEFTAEDIIAEGKALLERERQLKRERGD